MTISAFPLAKSGEPTLGGVRIDLPRLIDSRLLVQCNSGGGKSWFLRRVLEQTVSRVQQLVIDPEGEFSTLRERHDYIVCAPRGADAVANPQTAAALALALWKAGTSAILDIYELKAHERILFVRRFLEALTNAPRDLWHPTLVVIDESHIFAPQQGGAECLGAVVDLATRGRKRGLSLIAATQRISKLHKDVAAELLNKAVGRTGLDVDVKRAADELGMGSREATETLRNLEPGEFFVYGPALSQTVVRTRIGAVQTTHPETGKRSLVAPPPPSAKVRAQLAKIEGLQREAEAEAKSAADLAAEVSALKRKLTLAEKAHGGGVAEAEVQRRIREAIAAAPAVSIPSRTLRAVAAAIAALQAIEAASGGTQASGEPPLRARPSNTGASRKYAAPAVQAPAASVEGLRAGAVRILQELAARAPAGYSRAQVGALTQFSPKGGTFNTYLGDLRRGAFIEERAGLVYATERGITSLGDRVPEKPTTHEAAMALWRKALRAGAFAMLETIVAAGAGGLARQEVANAVGMQANGGTFNTYLGDLRRNGLIVERDKRCIANDILFPQEPR